MPLRQVICSKLVKLNCQCLNLKIILETYNHYILKMSSKFIANRCHIVNRVCLRHTSQFDIIQANRNSVNKDLAQAPILFAQILRVCG